MAADIAATVCDVNVPIALLAQQVFVDGSETICTTSAGDRLTIDQALNGPGGPPNAGGNNSQQEGLVNVSLGDANVLTGGTVCTSTAGDNLTITQAQ